LNKLDVKYITRLVQLTNCTKRTEHNSKTRATSTSELEQPFESIQNSRLETNQLNYQHLTGREDQYDFWHGTDCWNKL